MQAMYVFEAGKGINAVKINANFSELQNQTNTNETDINTLESTALLKDGSNITPSIVQGFNQQTPNILSGNGTIALADNSANFLTLTGNATISLPTVLDDQYSHTISLIVEGSAYSLGFGTTKTLGTPLSLISTNTYQVFYVYNKIDRSWYFNLGQ